MKTEKIQNKSANFENILRLISKQSGIILAEKIGFQLITFFSSILLARLLGPIYLGRYQLGLVTVQVSSFFCKMGLDRAFIKFLPVYNNGNKGKSRKVILDSVSIGLILSFGFGILLFTQASFFAKNLFHSADMTWVLKIFSFYVPVFTLFGLVLAVLTGFKRADIASHIQNIITPLCFLILLACIFLIRSDLYAVIIVRISSLVVAVGLSIIIISRKFSTVFKTVPVPYELKNHFNYCVPLFVIGLLYFMIGKLDILMLGYFVTSDHIGIYSISVQIAMLVSFALQSVNPIFAPTISELWENGDIENLEKLFKALTKWISYFSLFVFALILIFRVEILKVFGTSFTGGSQSLVILAFGQLVNASAGSTGAILLMTGRQKWEVLNSVGIIVLNVLFNLMLIPRFGIEGAALASTFSITLINIFKLIEVYNEFKFHPYSFKYIKGVIAVTSGSLIAFLYQYFLSLYSANYFLILFFGILLLLIGSMITLSVFKFDTEDEILLKSIAKKIRQIEIKA